MKKSMMKGMTVLVASMAFASCSHEAVYDENYGSKQKGLTYEQAFVKRFGAVSPDQEWDFTKVSNAGTRAAEGEVATAIAQFDMDNTGFDWIWKDSKSDQGELNQSTFKNLWEKNKDYIKGEIDEASYIPWNPSKYGKVYFRTFATSNDKRTYSKTYYRFGINVPTATASQNYWLAYADTKYDNWTNKGDLYMDHTRCLDFTKLPANTSWFAIAQSASGNHQNDAIYASEHQLVYFKEVTVNIEDENYTFWAFNCTGAGSNDNLILWVKAEKKPEVKVTEKRYMAEDLGGDCDTDFNDVVFDMIDTNGKQKMIIRALGGTLDIAIFVNGKQCWRKSADPSFKVKTMYNTTSPAYHDALKEIEDVEGWDSNANNVSIVVYGDGSQANPESHIDFPVKGSIPRMVAVSTKKYWQKEKDPVPNMAWFAALNE